MFILSYVAYDRVNLLGKLENKMSYNSNSNNKWLHTTCIYMRLLQEDIYLWYPIAEPLGNMPIALKQWSCWTS